MRALITGAAGFVGQWLSQALLQEGWDVSGATLEAPIRPADSPLADGEWRAIRWVGVDVRNAEALAGELEAARPDAIFHLAGVSFVPNAGNDPARACDVNALGAVRLLAALRPMRRAGTIDPAVLIVGSGQQYGRQPASAMPLAETTPQQPVEIYGASKAAQEVLALEAFRADGVRVVATRSFNHSGPAQSGPFLIPALVRRSLALRGATPGASMAIGNADTIRDYLHVSDVARAYILLAARGAAGEAYNVCSGLGHTTSDLAARIMERAGVVAPLEQDPALVRKVEIPVLVGDNSKLRAATGWRPERTVDDIIDDLIHAATR